MKKKSTSISLENIERFTPDKDYGLTSAQVAARTEQGLTNRIKKTYSKTYFSIFKDNICTFFNLLGFIVFLFLLTVKNLPVSNYFFTIIYLANIFIGIIQEIRAKISIDRLSLLSSKTVKVVRDGNVEEILSDKIVLDDIFEVGLGAQVPTDGIIVCGEVEVNESLLTGESVPVKKHIGDAIFAGSFIVSGFCSARADKVGSENYAETLSSKAKEYKKPQSELMGSLRFIIKTIGIVILPIATFFVIKSVISGDDYAAIVKGTSTLVIGMIPSGMFLLTSMALAVGVIKLASHKTLVQDLYSLEMLARVDTICFDKTGTITDGKMSVKEVIDLSGNVNAEEIIPSMINCLHDDNQTAVALYNYFGVDDKYKSESVLPFNSSRKFSAVTFNNVTYAYGAPEYILDKQGFENVKEKINEYAFKGFRVLLFAKSDSVICDNTVAGPFTPLSLIVLEDNIRKDAYQTVKWFNENRVKIKVISGDNPITVAEVSKRVNIPDCDKYISLEGKTDEEVKKLANEYTVFGRVSPEQKAILIKAIKGAGHVTAMTGDGVNDLLALKEADCAITVASGSDAARKVSHLVLLDNNFNSMPQIVYEGRRVINNVQSSASLFLMKTLFNIFLAVIMFFIPHITSYPFELSQMIMLEVFVIGLPAFFLSLQPNDALVEGRFINTVLAKSLPSAVIMILGVLAIDIFGLSAGSSIMNDPYKTYAIVILTLTGMVNLFIICTPLNIYRSVLFFICLAIVGSITAVALINGLPILNLSSVLPLSEYGAGLIIIGVSLIVDAPILLLSQKIFNKIGSTSAFNKIKEKVLKPIEKNEK